MIEIYYPLAYRSEGGCSMGRYENIIKLEQIRKKVKEGDFISAQKICDNLDKGRIKKLRDLNLIVDVYMNSGRYEEAYEFLLKIYDKHKTKKVIYQLVTVAIKLRYIDDAEKYLEEFIEIAPKDSYKYIFRYKIDKIKGEPFEKLILTLVILKKIEYIEQYAYELAKLYYKAGMEEECVNECSDIILWFGEGKYVEKAKLLKAYFTGERDKKKIIEDLKRRADNLKAEVETILNTEDQDDNEDLEITKDDDGEEDERRLLSLSQKLGFSVEESFKDFLHRKSFKGQLVNCLENILLLDHSRNLLMIVAGDNQRDRLQLIQALSVFFYKVGRIKSLKMAKITASKLNTLDLMSKKQTLMDCCMVIHQAGDLKASKTEEIMQFIEDMDGRIAIILDDNQENIQDLSKECPEFIQQLQNRISLV